MSMIGPLYVRSFNPVWFFVDLTGKPCDDTYYLWVLQNTVPYLPAPVYHSPLGTPWTEPIRLLANGTLPLDVYWDTRITYRLELRRNITGTPPSQNDQLIYPIENYIPAQNNGGPIGTEGVFTDNQITNAQFSVMNFQTFTLTGVVDPEPIEIAPGWFLDLAGNGTVVVSQVPFNNSPLINPTNAPYALRINLTGAWTSRPVLRQRLQQNGILWANKYVSTALMARIEGASQSIMARLDASNGQPLQILLSSNLTNDFVEYTGFGLLPASMNPDIPPDAYIEYKLFLPINADIYVTSFQLIASNVPTAITYQQDTIDRQLDHLFHYYNPLLQYKPIPSYLIGWDFPLNPAQFFGDTVAVQSVGTNKSYYAWDQTIIFQTANSAISVARAAAGGVELTAAQAGSFAVIQYLGREEALELLSGNMAVYLEGFASTDFNGYITLWATDDTNLPDIKSPNFNSLISGVSSLGVPTAGNGTWTKITRDLYGDFAFSLSTDNFAFKANKWNLLGNALQDTATFFAIVISFEAAAISDKVTLNRIGLYAGDIATRPAPQTPSEVEKICENFYEKSYSRGVVPGTVTAINALSKPQIATIPAGGPPTLSSTLATGFEICYRTIKRAAPILELYSPVSGTVDNIRSWATSSTNNDGDIVLATGWNEAGAGQKGVYFEPVGGQALTSVQTTTPEDPAQGWITFHYVAKARFGEVN